MTLLQKSSILIFVLYLGVVFPKVLVVVDKDYYNYKDNFNNPVGKNTIDQYLQDVRNLDSITIDTLLYTDSIAGTWRQNCYRLWARLRDAYYNSVTYGTQKDTLRGVVLVGNIPVPMFAAGSYNKMEIYPVDYYYMDLWNKKYGVAYSTDTSVWKYPKITINSVDTVAHDTVFDTTCCFDRDIYNTDADQIFDIWVSRVYGKSIWHLRNDGAVWGDFLDNYDIITNYFNRVHVRMHDTASVPPRGFEIGTNNFTFWAGDSVHKVLDEYLCLNRMRLGSLNHFILNEATPFNWQAQLQAGPFGNINNGAFKDMQFGNAYAVDCIHPEFYPDTRGYEWAGIFEHSGPQGHWFSTDGNKEWRGRVQIPIRGKFESFTNCSLWTRVVTGGYKNGSYYLCRNRDNIVPYDPVIKTGYSGQIIHWSDTLHKSQHPEGRYRVYLWYKPRPGYDSLSYVNICVNQVVVWEREVNQRKYYPPQGGDSCWQKLTCYKKDSTTWVDTFIYLKDGDSVNIELTAANNSPEILNDTTIADATMLVHENNHDTIIIDNDDNRFYSDLEVKRTFLSMQDDGGQSKTQYFLLQACHICSYQSPDCLGLLYAMGHNGLISMGASSSDWSQLYKYEFVKSANNGDCFGDAYLKNAQNYFTSYHVSYVLFGAGTLRSRDAYKPYYDKVQLTLTNTTIQNYNEIYVKKDALIQNNVLINNGNTLIIQSGKDIVINPDFLADYGSKLDLKVDPLQDR